jgi:hypothetical protein
MHRTPSFRSLLRRVAVTVSAVAFAFAALGSTPASAATASKPPTINTYQYWNGSDDVIEFGCPNTTTYGQVIKVPGKKHHLDKFNFKWVDLTSGSMVVRGEVYAWDGTKATGASLWESAPRTVSFGDASFHKETFKPGGISVTPGARYVIFASIDKDFEQCTDNYTLGWASVSDDRYAPGTFVFQNNGGDESQWTSTPWNPFGIDLAFKAYLSV